MTHRAQEQIATSLGPWILAASLVCWLPSAARAQTPNGILGSTNWLEFRLTNGRIDVQSRHFGRISTSMSSNSGSRQEKLSISINQASVSATYDRSTPEMVFQCKVIDSSHIELTRTPKDDPLVVPCSLVQPENDALVFTWGAENQRQQIRGPSLWHLMLADPAAGRKHLAPLVDQVRPDWNLSATMDKLVNLLCSDTYRRQPLPLSEWRSWVDELASERFQVRDEADQRLRAAGPAVRSFLENLDRSSLDAEQRQRIRNIVQSFSGSQQADTPESVAEWMATDTRVWLGLLNHPEADRRRVAAERLELLTGANLSFDATAEAEVRTAAVARIREQLFGPASPAAEGSQQPKAN